ncbi:efflux RND transporter permease subunit [Roseospirillum parvum]|uniref:Multidrug efflux pump n=1 Tax=Roseospirillum parvum TaxID=83401 RepID=A0A1G7Z6M9_9PROT|nr:efflux RND transporter permease subunit [Roseospirillum parvum]SDH04412.1 multidrug efflux pump [Roseospirillum parvum]
MSLIDAAINRTRTVLSTLLLILIAGTVSFVEIPKESAPDINIPIIVVSLNHQGISPEDAERLLLKPMEQELRTVEGLKEMRSDAREGGASVVLEFEAGFDADTAMDDVRRQVDIAQTELPEETDEPEVSEVNFSLFPILVVTLGGDVPERTLLTLARELQDELEGIPEVLEAPIGGDRDEQVEIIIDPVLLESYDVSASDFSAFLSRSNRLIAAGALDTGQGRFSIKVPGLLQSVEDVLNLPVKTNGDAVVRLRDIASGRRSFEDPLGFARVNGKPGLTIAVSKRIGENIIDTVAKVRQTLAEETADWPPGIEVHITQDQSKDIRDSLFDLQNSVVTAILLVMVVVVAALGLRAGLLVGVAIPGSFLTAILVLHATGLTINIVVLFGLILAVGMLVDGAIVVTEYADRKMSEGLDRKAAYALAAKRMAWPVIASTATTLAAFLPLVFWTGVVGEWMKYLPYTLLATLTASLVMALIFVPTLGSVVGRPSQGKSETAKAIAGDSDTDVTRLKGLTGLYARSLSRALKHPALVILASGLLLVAAQGLYWTFGHGVEFFPEVEPRQANVYVHARGNLSVAEKNALVQEVEARILDFPEIASVYTIAGESSQVRGGGEDVAADAIGKIGIEFIDWQQRPPATEILARMRAATADLAGISVEVRKQEEGPPTGKPIQVELSARDFTLLPAAVEAVRQRLEADSDYVDVEDSRPLPGIQWELAVDRAQAAKFGVDVAAVGDMVQMVTTGLKFSSYRPDDAEDEIDIVARYPRAEQTLTRLDRITVNTSAGPVPISSFVSLTPKASTGTLSRVDGKRVMTIKADVAPGVLPADKLPGLESWLNQPDSLPDGVNYRFRGEDEEQKKSMEFLGKAFIVALFLMAIILLTQFNSFYSAFLILSAVIMSTLGVMLGLLVFNQPFGVVMTGVGVISLAGIVVNNNIVLIDTFDRLKTQTGDITQAVLLTGVQRLRPVLLTTITTMLGLMPMMFKMNVDFVNRAITFGAPSMQWWSQLSIAVVCGLAFATVLTLVFTPCALKLRADMAVGLGRLKARLGRSPAEAAE